MCEDKGSAQGTPFVFTIIRELFEGKYHLKYRLVISKTQT